MCEGGCAMQANVIKGGERRIRASGTNQLIAWRGASHQSQINRRKGESV